MSLGKGASRERSDREDAEEIVNVRRRQGRAKLTRKKILEAATEEFASDGFEGVTTRSIAECAGVPHGLVIYHFETKLGVWHAVMEQAIIDFHEGFTATLRSFDGRDAVNTLRGLYRYFIELAAHRPDLQWLMSREVGSTAKALGTLIERTVGADLAHTVNLIREAQALGRYIEGDPDHLHFLYLGAASHIFMLGSEVAQTLGGTATEPEIVERHVQYCERLFFRNI